MSTDLEEIVRNLREFYDLAGKTVIAVGAGGGQLVEYAQDASHVVAIDRDAEACERLSKLVRERGGKASKFTIVNGDFETARASGDIVYFEFCLHEMPDPVGALEHAGQLAREVLVIDHAPGSPWGWYAAEDRGVEAGWAAVAQANIRRTHDVEAFQRFQDFAHLETRLAQQEATSLARIETLRGRKPITIPMPYRLALLDGSR